MFFWVKRTCRSTSVFGRVFLDNGITAYLSGTFREFTYSINNELAYVAPAYLNTDRVAWAASHHHDAVVGDMPYRYSYLFSYAIDLPPRAATLTLPKNAAYRIFAITVAKDDNAGANALTPLWPDLTRDADFKKRFGQP